MSFEPTAEMKTWSWSCETADGVFRAELNWSDIASLISEGKLLPSNYVTWEGLNPGSVYLRDLQINDYFFREHGEIIPISNRKELNSLVGDERIRHNTRIWGKKLPAFGTLFSDILEGSIDIIPPVKELLSQRLDKRLTIISGPNNSGKSYLLKVLHRELGPNAVLLACNRFYHFADLPQADGQFDMHQHYKNSIQGLFRSDQNRDNSNYPLPKLISSLTDSKRELLLDICSECFGEEFRIVPREPHNKMTKFYIQVDGTELQKCSTGTRLFLLLLSALMNSNTETVLIDEPEIGLSPSLQRKLSTIIYTESSRQELFPQLRNVYVVTHSHHFLDRNTLDNNYIVTKSYKRIRVEPIYTISDYHRLVLDMLGDNLTTFLLPEMFVLVEGPSDARFLGKIFDIHLPGKFVSVIDCGGDGRIAGKFDTLSRLLPNFHKTPYRNRTFVVLDANNSTKTGAFTRHGIPESNIVKLSHNGIEYYYPPEVVAEIVGCTREQAEALTVSGNDVSVAGVNFPKTRMAEEVANRVTIELPLAHELESALLIPMRSVGEGA